MVYLTKPLQFCPVTCYLGSITLSHEMVIKTNGFFFLKIAKNKINTTSVGRSCYRNRHTEKKANKIILHTD